MFSDIKLAMNKCWLFRLCRGFLLPSYVGIARTLLEEASQAFLQQNLQMLDLNFDATLGGNISQMLYGIFTYTFPPWDVAMFQLNNTDISYMELLGLVHFCENSRFEPKNHPILERKLICSKHQFGVQTIVVPFILGTWVGWAPTSSTSQLGHVQLKIKPPTP